MVSNSSVGHCSTINISYLVFSFINFLLPLTSPPFGLPPPPSASPNRITSGWLDWEGVFVLRSSWCLRLRLLARQDLRMSQYQVASGGGRRM